MELENYIAASDSEVVEMALNGDRYSFEHLFNRYRESLLKLFTQRYGCSYDDADDLMQETFIKTFLNLRKYDASYSFGGWIVTIAKNTFIDYVRKRRDDNLTGQSAATKTASSSPTPEENIINTQQKLQIEYYIEQMPEKYRTLIELRFMQELSYDEIAEKLQMPLGTIKTQIHRARTMLCGYLVDND